MKTDYYTILGLTRDASLEDIKRAFRKMALRYHPEKNSQSKNAETVQLFNRVCEAYEVLSDSKMRAIFDHYGEDGLKHGGSGEFGIPGGYKFNGDAIRVFQRFFGVANPFEQIGDFSAMQLTEHQYFSKEGARVKDPSQCPPIEVTLECTLEEVYEGAFKSVAVEITVASSPATSMKEKVELPLKLPKGILFGTKVVFEKKGNQKWGWIQGNVIVTIAEKKHARYRREGANLLMTYDITLEQALTGFSIDVETLDKRNLKVFVDEIAHPNFVKTITGEGMPQWKEPSDLSQAITASTKTSALAGMGDLLLSFNISFPLYLTSEQRTEVKRILNAKP